MFCSKCGANAQNVESYCTRCGEWLPDVEGSRRPGLFRKRTPEEKTRKMRILEAVSAGLAFAAGAIIFRADPRTDGQLLSLAGVFCVIVAIYQVANFYIGYKLNQRIDRSRSNTRERIKATEESVGRLRAADTTAFVNRASVVDNTTELLERVPRKANRDSN